MSRSQVWEEAGGRCSAGTAHDRLTAGPFLTVHLGIWDLLPQFIVHLMCFLRKNWVNFSRLAWRLQRMWGSVLRCPQAQNTCGGCWPVPGASPFPWPKYCSLGLYIRMFPVNYCRGLQWTVSKSERPRGLRAPELAPPRTRCSPLTGSDLASAQAASGKVLQNNTDRSPSGCAREGLAGKG